MAEYKKDKNLKDFHTVPKSLFRLLVDKKLSLTAYKLFVVMWERFGLSVKNQEKFTDKDGNIYVSYSYDELNTVLKIKGRTPIANAIRELQELNFITKKRQFNKTSRYYFNSQLEYTSQPSSTSQVKCTSDSQLKCTSDSQLTTDTNNTNINNTNINNTNIESVSKVASNTGLYYQTIKNYSSGLDLNYKSIGRLGKPLARIKEVINYAKANGKNEGWIYRAIKEDWELKEQKREINRQIGAEDHEPSKETMAIYEALGITEGGQ